MKTVFSIRTCDPYQVLDELYAAYKYVIHFLETDHFNLHLNEIWSLEFVAHEQNDDGHVPCVNSVKTKLEYISCNGLQDIEDYADDIGDWQTDVLELIKKFVITVEDQFYKLFQYPNEFYAYYDNVDNDKLTYGYNTNQKISWQKTNLCAWTNCVLTTGSTIPFAYLPLFKFYTTVKLFLKQQDNPLIVLPYVHATPICCALTLCLSNAMTTNTFFQKSN